MLERCQKDSAGYIAAPFHEGIQDFQQKSCYWWSYISHWLKVNLQRLFWGTTVFSILLVRVFWSSGPRRDAIAVLVGHRWSCCPCSFEDRTLWRRIWVRRIWEEVDRQKRSFFVAYRWNSSLKWKLQSFESRRMSFSNRAILSDSLLEVISSFIINKK